VEWMPISMPNQQHQSTEGLNCHMKIIKNPTKVKVHHANTQPFY